MRQTIEEIRKLLYAKVECIWIKSFEEEIIVKDIRELLMTDARLAGIDLKMWSNTEGIKKISLSPIIQDEKDEKRTEIPALFKEILETYNNEKNCIYILRDLDKLLKESKTIRYIRDFKEYSRHNCYNPFIIISPHCEIPEELAKLFRVVDYDLPDKEEISQLVNDANELLKNQEKINDKGYVSVDEQTLKAIISACQGLTAKEIVLSLRECVIKKKTLDLEFLSENKIQTVKKSGVLDYIIPKISLENLGGHHLLKKWLNEVKKSFSPEAIKFGVDKPKGMVAVGIAGCGKKHLQVC